MHKQLVEIIWRLSACCKGISLSIEYKGTVKIPFYLVTHGFFSSEVYFTKLRCEPGGQMEWPTVKNKTTLDSFVWMRREGSVLFWNSVFQKHKNSVHIERGILTPVAFEALILLCVKRVYSAFLRGFLPRVCSFHESNLSPSQLRVTSQVQVKFIYF